MSGTNITCIGDGIVFTEFLFMGLAIFIICLLGLIGNFLSTVVLLKSPLKSSVNLLLVGLTFCDTIVIVYSVATFALINIFGYLSTAQTYNYYWFPVVAPYLFPIASTGQTGSVYFTVAVTIERYIVVCWPLHAKSWCTSTRSRFYTIAVFLFSVLYNFTRWLEIKVYIPEETNANNANNKTSSSRSCYVIASTELRKDIDYQYYYVNYSYIIFMYFIPFMVLAVLNTSIYKRIRVANASRLRMTQSRSQTRENSIAQMLVSVVVVFLLCNFLALVNNALGTFWQKTPDISLSHLSNFLVTFNSCCNFAIYYIFGQKFRQSFIKIWNDMFPCCEIKSKPPKSEASYRCTRTTEVESLK